MEISCCVDNTLDPFPTLVEVWGQGWRSKALEGFRSMKRILAGLTFSLALVGGTQAEDTPPARLIVPIPGQTQAQNQTQFATDRGTLGAIIRTAAPDPARPVAGIFTDLPREMPKGTAKEDPMAKDGKDKITSPVIPYAPPALPYPNNPYYGPVIGSPIPGGSVVGAGPMGAMPWDYQPGDPSAMAGPAFMANRPPRFYARGEFLFWFLRSYSSPVLATIGPDTTPTSFTGASGVQSLYPADGINVNPQVGGRLTLGAWISEKWALEAAFFFVAEKSEIFGYNVPNTVLIRPFFSLNQNRNFGEIVNDPGQARGGIGITSSTSLIGFELLGRRRIWDDCESRLDFLVGARSLVLRETLTITENTTGLVDANVPLIFQGRTATIVDRFRTNNTFFGGEVGVNYERRWGKFSVDMTAKIAAGITRERVEIDGFTSLNNGTPSRPGGLYALDSNIGTHKRDIFSIVPEGALTLNYDFNQNIRLFAGYNIIYWSNVLRPGAQIDTRLDENRIPDFSRPGLPAANAVGPVPQRKGEDFFAQGVTFGVVLKWGGSR